MDWLALRRRLAYALAVADLAADRDDIDTVAGPEGAAELRLRDNDLFLILLAVCAGALAGLGVIATDLVLEALHGFAFDLPPGARLSSATGIPVLRVLTMPI